MEIKVLVVFAVLGVAAGFTVPKSGGEDNGPNTGLESSFAASYTDDKISPLSNVGPIPPEANNRDKRGLFKKWEKGHGQETIFVNRNYEQGSFTDRGQRDIHHHHHYSYPPPAGGPVYVENRWEPKPVPNQEYHHYEGGYQAGGYYGGGRFSTGGGAYYQKPGYVEREYYPGTYSAPPTYLRQPPVVASGPIAAGQNNVDRGQGAAAVNNIAIIHARAGSTSSHSNSKTLPRPLPVDFDDTSREGYGME